MEESGSTYGADVSRIEGSDAYIRYQVSLLVQNDIREYVVKMSASGLQKFNVLQELLNRRGCESAYYYSMLRFHLGVMLSGDFSQERRIDLCYSANAFKHICKVWLESADIQQRKLGKNQGCIGILVYNLVPPYYRASMDDEEYVRSACLDDFSNNVQSIANLVEHLAGENMRLMQPIDPEILSDSMAVLNNPLMLECLGIDSRYPDLLDEMVGECPKG